MIATPPFLIGASLLFWGWQTGNWIAAAILAVLIETVRRLPLTFDLGATEHSWVADLCTVVFVGLVVLLAINRGIAHGILAAFQWLPAALAPIVMAQMLSESRRVPLSALFRYMRKLRRENPSVSDPPVDTTAVYVAIILISAGVANSRGPGYYAGIIVATAWGLYRVRPKHAGAGAWALLFAAGIAGGYAGHAGLAQLQSQLETWVSDWYLKGFEGNPERASTDIGTLGRLKLLDTILVRVYVAPRDAARVRLLHRASYNTYIGTTWLARSAPMQSVASDPSGLTWNLGGVRPQWTAPMASRVERGHILLALPSTTTRITGLAANSLKRNALGSVHAELSGDWIQYEAEGAAIAETAAPPSREDLIVPASERATFGAVAAELGLAGLPPAEALRRVQDHFAGFSYSTWRDEPAAEGFTPLGDFVRNSRSGHCEYFAAATALLLRAAGIPARYATGFAVMEYSPLESAFVVRARHAHAWARAWDGGRWVDLDTTPPSWFQEEQHLLAPAWEKLMDLARWAAFRWSQRGEMEASDAWYGVLVILIAVLAWRLLRGRRVKATGKTSAIVQRGWPGVDSEFYAVERALAGPGHARDAGTPLAAWFHEVARSLDAPARERLDEALRLHERYRFDPAGLTEPERARLRELCQPIPVRP
jgi:protein-glutamine gamma-glutamyltransferase